MSPRILVVEDNATTRKMMRLALEAEGYSVLEAPDGESALLFVLQQNPSLVLLDCKLPDIDGFHLGRTLRVLVPGLPVIAVTGWAQADEARMLTGFMDVLLKPVEPSRLVDAVRRHLGQAPPRASDSGKSILLADDDPTQRKLGQVALGSAGFDVAVAEDGEAALRLARQRRPDAILSDVLMPRMDGFALCKAVRADPSLAGVPVILMSAHYLEEDDRELAARFGAARYVSRTAGFDAVMRAVRDAIDSPVADPVAQPSEDLQGEYLRRIAHQLERQATLGAGLARRVSLQASALSVLASLSDSLARQLDPESALGDTLAVCLDAAGLSVGAVLLWDEKGMLAVKAHVGLKVDLSWGPDQPILLQAIHRGGVMLPSREAGDQELDLLRALGAASALVLPIVAREQPLGVLLLASNGADLAAGEGESFVRAARSVSRQLGQALALSRVFSKLAAAEQRHRALLENAYDAIAILTPEGRFLDANRRWEEMLGLPRDRLLGHHIRDFAPQEPGQPHLDRRDEAVTLGSQSRPLPPRPLQRADGSIVHVEFTTTTIDVGGEQLVLSVGRDVTDRLRMEGERLRLEEQLRQSQKMEAIGRLAGGVAHDFNNVLSVILSYGDLLSNNLKPDEPMREALEEIQRAGRRAADLTRQLLMFSRQQIIEPKVLDLNDLLRGMDKMLQRILGADIDLVSLPTVPLGRVRVDPGSIEQVIMNLAVNARDAMPVGGKLTMKTANVVLDEEYARAHHGVAPGPHVMLSLTDTGTGMDKPTLARIFEPFFTTKEKGKGTGLGLSTVFGIVHQSGGSVCVYSEPGTGTTFKIYLPRVDATVDLPTMRQQAPATLRGSETILLVEDDEQVRGVALEILRRSGYHVIDARNAGDALLHAEKHPGTIHLVLTDVVMPQMSGPELAKRLASIRPGMKVLCMSGYTDDSIVRHGVLEARIAYLQKPLTPQTLARKVRSVLDNGDT